MSINFSTSLICTDLSNVKEELDTLLELDESFHWLHADFMDGHFVPRYGISPELIQFIRKRYGERFTIDSHLMVSDPYTYANVIAPYSDWYFFHVESVTDPLRVCQMLRKNYPKLKIGMAVNVLTGLETVYSGYCNNIIDGVMLMGISPGVLGTNSYPDIVLNKLQTLSFYNIPVFIDGSVNFKTIPLYKENGATTLVCGSSTIFKKDEETAWLFDNELIKYNADKMLRSLLNK